MSRDRTDPLIAILETLQEINGTLEVIAARVQPRIVIPRRREGKAPNMCGCGHPPHIGLRCGWPVGKAPHADPCECEG